MKAQNKKPRLVVDATSAGVNPRCIVPERISLPTVADVSSALSSVAPHRKLSLLSLDVKAAHKRVSVCPTEQGLQMFKVDSKLFFYRTCHFGGKWSAYWWGRVSSALLRLLHRFLYVFHAAFTYVDDSLLALDKDTSSVYACAAALFCSALGVPLACEKLALGSCITWNGWEINSDRRTAALPRSKRQAVCSQLRDLCEGPSKCSKKSLEKILGLIMWATNLLRFLRPWLSELYACLHTCPATLFSVSRENWAAFYESLKGTICIQEPQRFTPVAKGSQLVQVGRHKIRVFADVPAHAVSDRSAWVRIRNTDSSWVRLSVEARHVLQWLHKVFLHGPSEVSLVQPPISSFSCAADAMASGQSWGIGGWLESDGRLFVFSEKFTLDDLRPWLILPKDAQKYIASFEAIAQLCLLLMCARFSPQNCRRFTLCMGCDNTSAESSLNGLFTTSWPLSRIMQCVARHAVMTHIRVSVFHQPGASNVLADTLSREGIPANLQHFARWRPQLQEVFAPRAFHLSPPRAPWQNCLAQVSPLD